MINEVAYKKNQKVKIVYCWEDELLVFQLIKEKNSERIIISEASIFMKPDNEKLSILKSKPALTMFTI